MAHDGGDLAVDVVEPRVGHAQAVAPAAADYRPTDPQVAWHLARFVEQFRNHLAHQPAERIDIACAGAIPWPEVGPPATFTLEEEESDALHRLVAVRGLRERDDDRHAASAI